MLQIGSPRSVLAAAKLLEKFCFKKRKGLRILIDYYEDRITGTEALAGINQMVVQIVRLGKIRPLKSLPRYSEGKHNVARARGLKAAELRRVRRLTKS
jgi:hypothetical protein